MAAWHIGTSSGLRDTRSVMVATAPTAIRIAADPVLGLIEAYRERGDRRSIEQILHERQDPEPPGPKVCCVFGRALRGPPPGRLRWLMKAVSGFRLDSEAKFSSYAYAMIEGEIKHHLRDTALVKALLRAACTPGSPRRPAGSQPNSAGHRSSRSWLMR